MLANRVKKKERGSNFSAEETNLLMKAIFREIDVVENKKTDTASLREKKESWGRVCDTFNSRNTIYRSVHCIKTKFENVKRNMKKKVAEINKNQTLTGGSVDDPELNWYEEKLNLLTKDNVEGLAATWDLELLHSDPTSVISATNEDLEATEVTEYENGYITEEIILKQETDGIEEHSYATEEKNGNITPTEEPSTSGTIPKHPRKWNLVKRKRRVTSTTEEKHESLDGFEKLSDWKRGSSDVQKCLDKIELDAKKEEMSQKEIDGRIKQQELNIKEEQYKELLRENERKRRMFELQEEEAKVKIELLKCELKKKLSETDPNNRV